MTIPSLNSPTISSLFIIETPQVLNHITVVNFSSVLVNILGNELIQVVLSLTLLQILRYLYSLINNLKEIPGINLVGFSCVLIQKV